MKGVSSLHFIMVIQRPLLKLQALKECFDEEKGIGALQIAIRIVFILPPFN